jgi:hypothetical protein
VVGTVTCFLTDDAVVIRSLERGGRDSDHEYEVVVKN